MNDQPPQPLAIEFGESSNVAAESQNETIQTMDVGEGDAIKLDALGPIIVNNDGVGLLVPHLSVLRADMAVDIIENSELV
jgi:hypothetical protein